MAEVDETRLGLLVSRVGDNGSGNLSRDFQKLISETQTLASEHSSLLSEKLLQAVRFQPGKARIYAGLLCGLQNTQGSFVEEFVDSLFGALREALEDGDLLCAKNCVSTLGECVNSELLNAFSFIAVLMELLGQIEKSPQNLRTLMLVMLSGMATVQDFFSKKFAMEFKNICKDFSEFLGSQTSAQLDYCRRYFEALQRFEGPIPGRAGEFPASGRPLKRAFEFKLGRFGVGQQAWLGFEGLAFRGRGQFELADFLVAEAVRDMAAAFASVPQLFCDKFLALEAAAPLKFSLCADVLLMSCLYEDPDVPVLSFALVEKLVNSSQEFSAEFRPRLAVFAEFVRENAEEFSLRQLNRLAFHSAQMNSRLPMVELFRAPPQAVVDCHTYLLKAVQGELECIENPQIPETSFPRGPKGPVRLRLLREVLSAFLGSSLESKNFDAFLESHAIHELSQDDLASEFLATFVERAMASLLHFKTHVRVHKALLERFIKGRELFFLQSVLSSGKSGYQLIKFGLKELAQSGIVAQDLIVSFLLKKLLEEGQVNGKLVVEYLEESFANEQDKGPLTKEEVLKALGSHPSSPLGQKLVKHFS